MQNIHPRPATVTAKQVMLCWNPGTDQVALVPWPDRSNLSDNFRYSTLACNSDIHDMSFERRKSIAFIEAMHLIVRDKCDPFAVHKAMSGLREYCDGCSPDTPVWVGNEEVPLGNLFPDMDFRN